jgi:hypothetical protein
MVHYDHNMFAACHWSAELSDEGSETDDTTWRGNIIALLTGTLLAVSVSIVRQGSKSSTDMRLDSAAAMVGGALCDHLDDSQNG